MFFCLQFDEKRKLSDKMLLGKSKENPVLKFRRPHKLTAP